MIKETINELQYCTEKYIANKFSSKAGGRGKLP